MGKHGLGLATLLVAAACAPPMPPSAERQPALAAPSLPPRPTVTWRYHPRELVSRMWLPIDGHRALVLDASGGRWIATRVADAWSAVAIPDPHQALLRHAARRPDGGFLLVAEGGDAYSAATADGALTVMTRSPIPLRSYAGHGATVFGLDDFGGLVRLEGERWTPVPTSEPVHEVVEGRAGFVALGFPEWLGHAAPTGGAFLRAPFREHGAFAARATPAGAVVVEGSRGALVFEPDGVWREAEARDVVPAPPAEPLLPRLGPSAIALREGRATLHGTHYVELRTFGHEDARTFALWAGDVTAPLEATPLSLPAGLPCQPRAVALRGRRLAVVCTTESSTTLLASSDAGQTWPLQLPALVEPSSKISLAFGPSGALLVAGAARCGERRCPVLVRLEPGRARLEAVSVPDAMTFPGNAPSDLTSSLDWSGPRPAFLALTEKHGVTPFVSDDGGRTFRAHLVLARSERARVLARRLAETTDLGLVRARTASDGALSLELELPTGPSAATIAADGSVLAMVAPRDLGEVLALSGRGNRWLVVTRVRGDGSRAALWQSLDGGGSFHPLSPPVPLEGARLDALAVECSDEACVVGDFLTRVGWSSSSRTEPAPFPSTDLETSPLVQSPMVCTVSPDGFFPIEDVDGGALPSAEEAYRGSSSWSLLVRGADGAVSTVRPSSGSVPRAKSIERRALFPALGRERTAERIDVQAEGWIGLRAVPVRTGGHRIDVAWEDVALDRRGRGVVRTASLPAEAFGAGPRPYLHGAASAITPAGAWVRLAAGQGAYFLDAAGRVDGPLSFGESPISRLELVETATFAGGPVSVTLHLDEHQVIRAVSTVKLGGGGRHDAAIAPAGSEAREVLTHWSYAGEVAGVLVHLLQRDRARAMSYFLELPLDAREPKRVPVPTQSDLRGGPIAPCTERERRETPRVVAPFLLGSRHPVIIEGQDTPMMTSEAILHGVPERPCVVGFVADPSRRGGARAFVSLDGSASWLLRVSPMRRLGIDAARMQCREAPERAAPSWVRDFAATEAVR